MLRTQHLRSLVRVAGEAASAQRHPALGTGLRAQQERRGGDRDGERAREGHRQARREAPLHQTAIHSVSSNANEVFCAPGIAIAGASQIRDAGAK